MRKLYLSAAILLLSAAWAAAQSSSPTTPQSTKPDDSSASQQSQSTQQTSPSGQGNETIEGCLSGSAGSFTLTDSSTGKTYTLTGETATLSDHVGHEVRLTGSSSEAKAGAGGAAAGAAAAGAGAAGGGATSTFEVKKAKMISSSCTKPSR